jgi:hypothetical protein
MPSAPYRNTLLIAAAVLFTSPAGLIAQSAQRFSAQGSLIHVSPSGEAYEGLGAGVGFELQARYTPSALSLGAGYQSSSHDLDLGEFGTESATIAGFFLEPRYVIDIGRDNMAPYIAGRLAFLTQKAEFEGIDVSASGTQINIGGGLLIRLTPRVNVDLGLTYGAIDFDDVEAEFGGETVTFEGTGGSGKNLVLRAGIAVGLGG